MIEVFFQPVTISMNLNPHYGSATYEHILGCSNGNVTADSSSGIMNRLSIIRLSNAPNLVVRTAASISAWRYRDDWGDQMVGTVRTKCTSQRSEKRWSSYNCDLCAKILTKELASTSWTPCRSDRLFLFPNVCIIFLRIQSPNTGRGFCDLAGRMEFPATSSIIGKSCTLLSARDRE